MNTSPDVEMDCNTSPEDVKNAVINIVNLVSK